MKQEAISRSFSPCAHQKLSDRKQHRTSSITIFLLRQKLTDLEQHLANI